MELNSFEKLVIKTLIEHEPEVIILNEQLLNAKAKSREYTGAGLFTELKIPKSCRVILKSKRYIEDQPKIHLNHPNLKNGAGTILWLEGGKISTLECFTYGESWPEDDGLFTIDT